MAEKTNIDAATTMFKETSRICGTDSLHKLISTFNEKRKTDAEINNSGWRLGNDNHIDGYYLGSQKLHTKLSKKRG